ncbi:MAG: class I SAM-dependent methyltransferase, partial [Smithellaceae bacterium]|nr:class I SAM-dependent methyltransferase [Smithellaceae bacterium]
GWLLVQLYRKAPAAKLVGADISPAMVAKAKENLAKEGLSDTVIIEEASASHLAFPDASFDIVVSTGSVHHWKEPVAALNEIHRVLAPGGHALLYDIMSDTPREVLRGAAKEFGRFRIMLLWLHAFEEPFLSGRELEAFPRGSLFGRGETRYVGVLNGLIMKKDD